jgi:hypothetical protein
MKIRDRIKELRRVRADQLRPNPLNWRTHPPAQADALRGVLSEIGYASALLARELDDGTLELIDGHLRAETTPDAEVPVLVLDVDEHEARTLLATLDPLAALATTDAVNLDQLLAEVETESESLERMWSDLLANAKNSDDASLDENLDDDIESELKNLDVPTLFQIIVECKSEAEQRELFERLRGENFECRLVNL